MKTIEEVLIKLDEIILWSKENKSPLGYFACTYRATTAQVLRNIELKKFEDNPRMVRMDVDFALRYIDAWGAYQKGKKCTHSWYLTFEAAKNDKLLILHHIFLGMNAHINLDLGISAAAVMPYRKINPLKKDFVKINSVIASINQNVQEKLNEIFYPIDLLDKISNGKDNAVLDFAISRAREASWTTAVIHSNTPKFLRESVIDIVDYATAKVATQILHPKLISSKTISDLRSCESQDIVKNIEILQAIKNV
ncbi:DUF5995 family protein [Moheibacter lacus]|uniref:Uncharacterized protein n=1 Tax=Moheibacter lacus TaxID=2745851 RepID=A0A838ZPA2_9FLAO|nr:DUF5995 family protein [Moheibacter lacus]MBA5628615.1 hypothetical protein [Moheibacter lacus]